MRVQTRRTDVFPTTWEIPAGIGLIWLLGSVLALPAGQGVAFVVLGHDFVWPGPELGHSLGGLLTGEPGRGLAPPQRANLPPGSLVYLAVVVVEIALTSVAFVALAWWSRTVGPTAQFGMAARHEVSSVLGRGQLIDRGKTIRPDLASRRRR
jgi:hypothetical protein